jgi:hypothetical protein
MLILYTFVLLLLGVAKFLTSRRVTALERKYGRVAKQADKLLRETGFREGNSGRVDPYQAAKRQYLLGVLAQKRDRLEHKYDAWQARAEKVGAALDKVRGWKGRKLPYTFGVLDVVGALTLIDYLGAGQYTSPRYVIELVSSVLAR